MKVLTFKGGIHPPEGKELSEDKSLKKLKIPEQVIIPLSQHIGAPAKPIVEIGDEVKTGQKIAEANSKISANIHSSITGKVKAIGEYLHPALGKARAVVIEKTEGDEWIENKKIEDYDSVDSEKLVEIIRERGIVGMGGATFPTDVKLSPPPWKDIDYVILNGAECEPYLTCDDRLMREKTEEIIEGLKIIMKIVDADKGFIGIEHNKPSAIKNIQKLCKNINNIEVKIVKTKYPQGAEKQLIKAITNREVPVGGLPLDVGVVVQNVGTSLAIYEAIVEGKPLIERAVTVSGEAMNDTANFIVRIGDTFENLIEKAGGLKDNVKKIISGGPMMGIAQHSVKNVPVLKGVSGILAFTDKKTHHDEELPCISCASCVDICPMKLIPSKIVKFIKNEKYEEADELEISACIECGSCAYVCPSKIPIVQYMKIGKNEVRKINAQKKQEEEK
ncbi:MAG: electron transport complex subunit RsxC [Candidatus Mcinerneyibacterium aminivorans]|uniref:Ion-translocating oxidoreductase complex subunit C n=1 Tax=Candidatus Mcinerneyibacterium aminivorans TaxID=2703815 RepID=A0A5D0MGD7_9BACT|nr:MAG: electron transport complex subunit RsxC [Candidatus Mcinerneyibacterium aminivorans]